MKLDTKAIRARAEAATEGPWAADGDREYIYSTATKEHPCVAQWPADMGELFSRDDLDFVLAARTDVPALCDRVEALEAALGRITLIGGTSKACHSIARVALDGDAIERCLFCGDPLLPACRCGGYAP